MVEREFTSELVEEFYNSCHTTTDGRFCGRKAKGKKVIRVPMSDAARKSNALLRGISAARKTKEYRMTRNKLKGLGTKKKVNPNKANPSKDGSDPLKGKYKTTGNKAQDAINITRLDRGSPERKRAAAAFEKAYGGK
jgi:hypothetical protein